MQEPYLYISVSYPCVKKELGVKLFTICLLERGYTPSLGLLCVFVTICLFPDQQTIAWLSTF